ncbi:MAG: nucleotidyltransferase domain-containing protein [bacterium]
MNQHKSRGTSYTLGDCGPNPDQLQLLRIATGDTSTPVEAWENWLKGTNLDDIDRASFRVLPIIYQRLSQIQSVVPELERLKGLYRYSWYKNQMMLNATLPILRHLHGSAIPIMLLKGGALSSRYYSSSATRFMHDLDILIPIEKAKQAVQVLLTEGWQPIRRSEEQIFNHIDNGILYSAGFKRGAGELDLHWQLQPLISDAESEYWSRAKKQKWNDLDVHVMSATDLLYHICAHGLLWCYGHLTWIVDANMIIRGDESIDWDAFVDNTIRTRQVLPVRNALVYLSQNHDLEIPQEVIEKLDGLPTSMIEKLEFSVNSRKPKNALIYAVNITIIRSSRFQYFQQPDRKPLRIPVIACYRYLKTRWGADDLASFLSMLGSKMARNVQKVRAGIVRPDLDQ